MPATTKSPTAANLDARRAAIEGAAARRLDEIASEFELREQALDAIIDRYGDGDFIPAKLNLSRGEVALLLAKTSYHDLCRDLALQRDIRELRRKYGSPAVLNQAEADLAAAREAEQTTSAALADLETTGGTSPVLSRQIGKLSEKLAALSEARRQAESRIQQIHHGRATIRLHAPQWLRDAVAVEVAALNFSHPAAIRLRELKPEIDGLEKVVSCARRGGATELLKLYARHSFPEAVRKDNMGGYDAEVLAPRIDWLERDELQRLWRERDALQKEVAAAVTEIEQPLDRFVELGIAS